MSNLKDSPEYKALTDSLDRLAEGELFCALIALFRSLFALLSAIKSGAIVLPPPPVVEPRSGSTSVGTRAKGVDGRDEHDHDADRRRVRGPSEAAVAVARPMAEVAEDLPSHTKLLIRRPSADERVPAPVHAPHEMPLASWVTVNERCFRNGLEAQRICTPYSLRYRNMNTALWL